jgi:hypothetical protein
MVRERWAKQLRVDYYIQTQMHFADDVRTAMGLLLAAFQLVFQPDLLPTFVFKAGRYLTTSFCLM